MSSETKKYLTPEEKWEQATIANNFIFYKVMRHHPDVCKQLLEILLEIEIDHIEMNQEETVEVDFGSKAVRLDVYAKNAIQAFNVELQAADTKELPERARYYQSIIDVDCLKSGEHYKNLKDSFVIFICIDDIFEKGLAKYTFLNTCQENTAIKLNDRTYKYFFIAKNCDKLVENEKQRAFLRLITKNESNSAFTDNILNLVNEAKKNTQWKRQYMDLEREKLYAYDDGVEEGERRKAIETASNFLKMNVCTVEQIASATGLSVDEVLKLKAEL